MRDVPPFYRGLRAGLAQPVGDGMMSLPKLFVQLLIDRTGSMESDWDETISALNAYIARLSASGEVEARIGLAFFDLLPPEPVLQWKPDIEPGAWEPLSAKDPDIFPRGSTPLYDAVVVASAHLRARTKLPGEREQMVIMTDGAENASQEATLEDARKTIAGLEESGVPVTFLSAGLAATQEGVRMGSLRTRSSSYLKSKTFRAMEMTAVKSERYGRSGTVTETDYTAEERKELSEDDDPDGAPKR